VKESLHDAVALMEALIEYRQKPITNQLQTVRHKTSMLHLDVLTLIYYLAATGTGDILEIGPYLGGSTIAAGLGARAAARSRAVTTIEPGGKHQHHRLPSRDIVRDLRKNLAKHGLAESVRVLPGYSWEEKTIAATHAMIAPGSIGLFMIDADGDAKRDLELYRDLLADGCHVVIDDYFGLKNDGKDLLTRPQVDALVAVGELQTLGVYGWGTWIGRWWGSSTNAAALA
jgi:predicted O-methyltransferase YrrM